MKIGGYPHWVEIGLKFKMVAKLSKLEDIMEANFIVFMDRTQESSFAHHETGGNVLLKIPFTYGLFIKPICKACLIEWRA